MRRRDFAALIGSAAALWPIAAGAQQKKVPVIGFLRLTTPSAPFIAAFRQGLAETGYVEGQNVAIEYRATEGRYGLLRWLAADLVARKVDVIVTTGGTCGEKRDLDDPDRLRNRSRPGRFRPRRQFRPARRQPDRGHHADGRAKSEAA